MSRYPLGQPVRLPTTVTQVNTDGTTTLVTPDTLTLTVKVQNADGTTTTTGTYDAPTEDATGTYHQDVPTTDLTAIGHYQYTWVSTGTGAGVSYGDFDVFDPFEIRVISLQDTKDMLNIPQSQTDRDAELLSWIGSIESGLERMTGGPAVNTQITERCEAMSAYTVLIVRQRPLVSLVSVINVGSGLPVDFSDMTDLDPNAGTIRRQLGWPFFGPFYQYLPIFLVTYVAGWGVSVPPAFNNFARVIIRHLWDTQRGTTPAPMLGGDDTTVIPGFGFAIPNRALELLNGSQNGIPFLQEAWV